MYLIPPPLPPCAYMVDLAHVIARIDTSQITFLFEWGHDSRNNNAILSIIIESSSMAKDNAILIVAVQ